MLRQGIIRVAGIGITVAALFLSGGQARAHPHVFIDAGVALLTDDAGRITGVEVTWVYDELYSLILLQDYELDPDFDNRLTEAEVSETLGFDLNWNSGFDGGLTLERGATALVIGPPEAVSLRLGQDGRMETVHRRAVTGDPGGSDDVVARIYDEAFYIAFEAILPSGVLGADGSRRDCPADLVRADLDAAYAVLEAALAELGGVVAAEDNFPPVGAAFADSLVFSCAW